MEGFTNKNQVSKENHMVGNLLWLISTPMPLNLHFAHFAGREGLHGLMMANSPIDFKRVLVAVDGYIAIVEGIQEFTRIE